MRTDDYDGGGPGAALQRGAQRGAALGLHALAVAQPLAALGGGVAQLVALATVAQRQTIRKKRFISPAVYLRTRSGSEIAVDARTSVDTAGRSPAQFTIDGALRFARIPPTQRRPPCRRKTLYSMIARATWS